MSLTDTTLPKRPAPRAADRALISPTTRGTGWPPRLTVPRAIRRPAGDAHVVLAVVLAVPVVLTQFLGPSRNPGPLLLAASTFIVAQVLAGRLLKPSTRVTLLRLGAALVFVTTVTRTGSGPGIPPLLTLYTPIIVLAAAIGRIEAIVIGGAAIGAYLAPFVFATGDPFLHERGLVLASMTAALAFGTRRTVGSLERVTSSLRTLVRADRRRARRLAAIEDAGRLLVERGTSEEALLGVMDLLTTRIGYSHASLYLGGPHRLSLAAQRGYDDPITEFVPDVGVLGRVMRTAAAELVEDVSADADYRPTSDRVQSLISVPLIATGEVVGAVNVESSPPDRLDRDDLATVRLVGERLASALALARERDDLAARAACFERLTALAHELTATLREEEVEAAIARSVTAVVPADVVVLCVRDRTSGQMRLSAWPDRHRADAAEAAPGALARRAAAARQLVLAEGEGHGNTTAAAIPLLRGDEIIGALELRRAGNTPFDGLDREVLPLIASQVALAISNAHLHAATMDASIRDPLTGLYNRRYLDAAIGTRSAARRRQAPAERGVLSVVLFDLDQFGRFNKAYGHALGDEVLRRFATILTDRARGSDLVARAGGEEFLAILDGASPQDAHGFAEDVRTRLEAATIDGPDGTQLRATVSAGTSTSTPATTDLAPLLAAADVGLAMAKHAGRNAVVSA